MLEPMAQEMGKEILRFHRLYGEKISRRFRQLHIDRLSQTEYLLLAIIVERKHLPMSELCERAMMRKQQVTQTVNQLEDKSLVVRVRNNENRRVVWLEPTEQALEIAREVQRALVEELSRIFGQLKDDSLQESSFSWPKDDSLQESLQAMRTINHILERFPSSSPDEKEV